MVQFAVLTALKMLTPMKSIMRLSSVAINCKDFFTQFMGNNTMIYQAPKEQKKGSPISQLRLEEKKREGANPLSINRLYYLYTKLFSASLNFPCPSTLINCSGCYGNFLTQL